MVIHGLLLPSSESGKRVRGELHLAFSDDEGSPADVVVARLRSTAEPYLSADAFPGFYTLQFDMQAYRSVVSALGVEEARDFLVSLHDLVAVRESAKPPVWLPRALSSRQFTLAFMRASETFFAYHNAASLLSGLDYETRSGLSPELNVRFKLPVFANEHVIPLAFQDDGLLPRRVAVLIGKNGVGKSQALHNIASSLLRDDDRVRDGEGRRPMVNRLLAVSSPGESSRTFPSGGKRDRIPYRRILLRQGSGTRTPGLGDVLVQLARSSDTVFSRSRWEMFAQAIANIVPMDDLALRRRGRGPSAPSSADRPDYVPVAEMLRGGEQDRLERWGSVEPRSDLYRLVKGTEIVPLSSGQLTFMRFAAQACLYIENGTLLLFDEPETHLHPNLITDFMGLLDQLLSATSSFAILATHSAFVVREVQRSQVRVLRQAEGGDIQVIAPRLKTLGADVGEISLFVFGDELFGRLIARVKELIAEPSRGSAALLESVEDEISTEAWMNLRRELDAGARQ